MELRAFLKYEKLLERPEQNVHVSSQWYCNVPLLQRNLFNVFSLSVAVLMGGNMLTILPPLLLNYILVYALPTEIVLVLCLLSRF